jgi:hypothetical protein
MSAFITHDYQVSDICRTTEKIKVAVCRNGGVLSSYGFGFSCPGSSPDEPINGWRVSLVDTRGMGNHGSFVAISMRPDTYQYQLAATLRLLRV